MKFVGVAGKIVIQLLDSCIKIVIIIMNEKLAFLQYYHEI